MDFVLEADQGQTNPMLRFEVPIVEAFDEHETDKEGQDEIHGAVQATFP